MGYEDVSLLGGLAQGFAQGQQASRKLAEDELTRESQAEMNKLKAQALKIELENKKLEAQRAKMFEPIIAQIIQAQLPQQAPTAGGESDGKFGESFGEAGEAANKTGVSQQAAMMQMMQNPLIAALLEKSGLAGAGKMPQHNIDQQRLSETRRGNDIRQAGFDREATQGTIQELPPAGAAPGVTQPMFVPKFGGVPRPVPGLGSTPPKLGNVSVQQGGEQYSQPTDPYSGQPSGAPIKTGEAKGESADAAARIALTNQGISHVKRFKEMVTPNGHPDRKMVFAMNAPMGGYKQGRQAKAIFVDALDARARAATGAAMPESEIANYERMYFPSPLDDDKTILDKVNRLDAFLSDYMRTLDPSGNIRGRLQGGQKVQINANSELPKTARDKLKEGEVTVFGNGQKWTLQNGEAVRVP